MPPFYIVVCRLVVFDVISFPPIYISISIESTVVFILLWPPRAVGFRFEICFTAVSRCRTQQRLFDRFRSGDEFEVRLLHIFRRVLSYSLLACCCVYAAGLFLRGRGRKRSLLGSRLTHFLPFHLFRAGERVLTLRAPSITTLAPAATFAYYILSCRFFPFSVQSTLSYRSDYFSYIIIRRALHIFDSYLIIVPLNDLNVREFFFRKVLVITLAD